MIALHCTRKLLAKLPVDASGHLPQPLGAHSAQQAAMVPSVLGAWHANLLTLQRRNCVLMVHDATRFPLFLPALKKADFARLDDWFVDALMNTLMKCGATGEQMNRAAGALQPLRIDSVCDRSVQGTLNRMAHEAEHMLWYENVSVTEITGYRLAASLADRPCTVKGRKGCIWPQRDFMALVDSLPLPAPSVGNMTEPGNSAASAENVVSMAAFRANKSREDGE